MPEELDILLSVTQRLNQAGISYMLGGAMALGFYTSPRMTRDIDIVVELRPEDGLRLHALFTDGWYADSSAIADAIRTRRMFNVIHLKSMIKVDFIVRKLEAFDDSAFQRRNLMSLEGQPISVVSVEDLILSKLRWGAPSGSSKQAADVAALLASSELLDWAYIEYWLDKLCVRDYFNSIRTQ